MKLFASLLLAVLISYAANGQMHYTVSVDTPYFHVQLQQTGIVEDSLLYKMPAWTPGYYQLMHYAKEVAHFSARDANGHPLPWEKREENGWMVYCKKNKAITLEYDVRSTRPFVAANYLDKDCGYISPAGMFLHVSGKINTPVTVTIKPLAHWNRTRMLWVSEGFTVYYEYIMLKRAGITTQEDVLKAITANIRAYESKPGRLEQSVAAASYETWEDGPFGKPGSISYYDKGPVLAALLDLKIRHETKNSRSLDDVMRTLYYDYYKKAGRGFTATEFRTVCENIAGTELSEFFDYANTVKPLDYKKYFAYAGLDVTADFTLQPLAEPSALQVLILKDWLR